MARVPYINREDLDANGQKIYDQIRGDRNASDVALQFRALLNSPEATGYFLSMGAQLRFQSSIPEDMKELAISLTGKAWESDIIWTGHSARAAQTGISKDSLESIRTGHALRDLTGMELAIAKYVQEMVHDKKVSDATFEGIHSLFGDRGAVDLTLTISYYSALALSQLALNLEMEPGRVSTL